MRKKILIENFKHEDNLDLEEMTKALIKLKTIYDQADNAVTSFVTRNNEE